jgi:GTPase SAR1 family protein
MIWDVEGFETPESNTQNYFTGSTGAIIVADLTRQDTIDSIKQTVEFVKGLNPKTVVFIAGNKADLVDEKHPGSLAMEQLSHILKLPLFFTSAKDGQNVELCFNQLAEHILANQ